MILDPETKELIAIGASITAHCQPCLTYHLDKAREAGGEDKDDQRMACILREKRFPIHEGDETTGGLVIGFHRTDSYRVAEGMSTRKPEGLK